MDAESKHGLMEPNMMVNIKWGENMDKGNLSGLMEAHIMANF